MEKGLQTVNSISTSRNGVCGVGPIDRGINVSKNRTPKVDLVGHFQGKRQKLQLNCDTGCAWRWGNTSMSYIYLMLYTCFKLFNLQSQ